MGLVRPGVGGWLALLVFGLLIGFPLLGGGQLNDEFLAAEARNPGLQTLQQWATLKLATWSAFAGFAVVSLLAGWGLARSTRWLAVRRAIGALWIVGPLRTITLGLAVPMLTLSSLEGFDSGETVVAAIGSTMLNSLAAMVWTAYLLRSRRVRSRYVS